ncbi:NAD-dependent dehydratase [Xanthomonas vesicatoria ATCC 35937]|uniref:Putative nucleoside-diphosphate sugar epimerase n=1 Tax=Xanthomonas vesicatoria ATCC 35937 TaxID=925775 RepID=F0BED3_9XANT|nr:NAD-dependent epimerase/dehydratase family protein [Xanthomonas vesicatoria]APP76282.1 NAD-dependent dehydratase [Xanthomonas vesicatoria ATCC 35937]EGD09167.1 putative nucleoside-diphosphate sugar epimerase [Xanthomonas vesicatoria ATCC 35937]KTF33177.1 NAD-dependent dehydratase [Xanthomonas vesicatoria]MCC8598934.1 NAD-dependent epimerase/dehydratase family protein [Xanthomonas vesicatoria]MCC8606940.1 NAD-dependent epimerase/dehydratase family protein [Xanthomonas vesicatoria]
MDVLLAGATGLVGGHVLQQLLADARCTGVVAITRRPLSQIHPKLRNQVIDFERLDHWTAPRMEAAICALGSTMKQAGSREAFYRIDHDYPLALARAVCAQGTSVFVLNSAAGADAQARIFYSCVKGELERDLRTIGFPSLTLVRPGLIGGEREERRTGEHLGRLVLGALGPVLPRRFRINPAERIAAAMVGAALAPARGEHRVEAAELVG